YTEAINLYRKVLAQEPRHILALNNLANLLALTGANVDEALSLIDAAIDESGPNAELLDSRALINLKKNKPDLAILDLLQANAQAPSPGKYFHLAQAQLLAKDMPAARDAFDRAKKDGLKAADLHSLERDALEKMPKDMEKMQ